MFLAEVAPFAKKMKTDFIIDYWNTIKASPGLY